LFALFSIVSTVSFSAAFVFVVSACFFFFVFLFFQFSLFISPYFRGT